MVISGIGAVKFNILFEEWPKEAKRLGLKDPWRNDHKQMLFVDDEVEVMGKMMKCTKAIPNPNAPPKGTFQEKKEWKLAENKFLIDRLLEEGYDGEVCAVLDDLSTVDTFGIADALKEYVRSRPMCGGPSAEGQCTAFCAYYSEGECKYVCR